MTEQLKSVLKKIAELLNNQNITWAVGASIMLSYYNIVKTPRDIDIMVDLKDIERLDCILCEIGEKRERLPNSTYKTKFFYEYVVDDIDIDVMAGLRIHSGGRDHPFYFTENSVGDYMEIDGVRVPLAKLSEWYYIYKLIPGREKKAAAIKEYLEKAEK